MKTLEYQTHEQIVAWVRQGDPLVSKERVTDFILSFPFQIQRLLLFSFISLCAIVNRGLLMRSRAFG